MSVAYLYDLFWAAVPDVCNMLLLMMFALLLATALLSWENSYM